mmetsp:Transcript_714/g.1622  ORF Transcript_714/g.1622 Transcript_714/m.1622 type:complete len:302 (-) Transcript_714:21-926(-)
MYLFEVIFGLVFKDSKAPPLVVIAHPANALRPLDQLVFQIVQAHNDAHDATRQRLFLSLGQEHSILRAGFLSFLDGVGSKLSGRHHDHERFDIIRDRKVHHIILIAKFGFEALCRPGFEGFCNGVDGRGVDRGPDSVVFSEGITDFLFGTGRIGNSLGIFFDHQALNNVLDVVTVDGIDFLVVVVVVVDREYCVFGRQAKISARWRFQPNRNCTVKKTVCDCGCECKIWRRQQCKDRYRSYRRHCRSVHHFYVTLLGTFEEVCFCCVNDLVDRIAVRVNSDFSLANSNRIDGAKMIGLLKL